MSIRTMQALSDSSDTEIMPHPAYGGRHQKIRAALLVQLRAIGVAFCPICGGAMDVSMRLDLHHTDPRAKALGLPGDCLAHSVCNRRLGRLERAKADALRLPLRTSREW